MTIIRSNEPSQPGFWTALICNGGHVLTASLEQNRHRFTKFCDQCGKPTSLQCHGCSALIRGDEDQSGSRIYSVGRYTRPAYCPSCGEAFPWTESAVQASVEALKSAGQLEGMSEAEFRSDLKEVIANSPLRVPAIYRIQARLEFVKGHAADIVKSAIGSLLANPNWMIP